MLGMLGATRALLHTSAGSADWYEPRLLSPYRRFNRHRFLVSLIQSAMGSGLAVSVLDLVGMRAGEPAGSAIARSVDLAQHVEEWGYKRYWLAEHHSISGLACSATAVLIGHVAAATKTIRVGSGGVMLPNHAPLVVAEQFGTLEAIYPGRIDLGLGRPLRAVIFKPCGRSDEICGRVERTFPLFSMNSRPIWARRSRGKW